MAKEITTTGSKKLKTLMKEFNEQYPYLRLGIYDFSAKEKVLAGEEINSLDIEKRLCDVRTKVGDGEITINGNKFIGNLEKEFENIFGLYVQVCYTSSSGDRFYSSSFEKLPEGITEDDLKNPEIAELLESLNDDRKTIYAFNEMKREEGCKKGEWK
jgi:hypothetical protein